MAEMVPRSVLLGAVKIIKQWHDMPMTNEVCKDSTFKIYYELAPEMKVIRETIGPYDQMKDEPNSYNKEIDEWSRDYIRENPQVEYTMIRKAFEFGAEKFRDTIHARVVKEKDEEIEEAKNLLKRCVHEFSDGEPDELSILSNDIFDFINPKD